MVENPINATMTAQPSERPKRTRYGQAKRTRRRKFFIFGVCRR